MTCIKINLISAVTRAGNVGRSSPSSWTTDMEAFYFLGVEIYSSESLREFSALQISGAPNGSFRKIICSEGP